MEFMHDSFGREVTELRISLTQKCNLSCIFCHMEGQPPSQTELTVSEITRIVDAATMIGIRTVKLTGGEPTLRSDVVEIVHRISPLVDEVSMTTNGLRLSRLARDLKKAGLRRVNVNIPSAFPRTYCRLTGAPSLDIAIHGAKAAIATGLVPVKLNVIVLRNLVEREEELNAMLSLAKTIGASLQFIEFENVRGRVDGETYRILYSPLTVIESTISSMAFKKEIYPMHNRPVYSIMGEKGPITVVLVRPLNNPVFCAGCWRIRLTSSGQLKGCLMTNRDLVDVRMAVRAGATREELAGSLSEVISKREPFFRDDAIHAHSGGSSGDAGLLAWPEP